MLTDAKSLAAVVNKGIFLSGSITAGDPFYMKWSNFLHRTHTSYNYSGVVVFFFLMFSSKQSAVNLLRTDKTQTKLIYPILRWEKHFFVLV